MYTVLDLEFNQAYAFEDDPVLTDPQCRFEIIQIGAVKLDKDLEITDSFNTYIKPVIYTRLHPYVEKITGITLEDLNDAPAFPEAFTKFRDFVGDSIIMGIWGNSDLRALYRNLCYHNMSKEPFILKYVDIQQLATAFLKYGKGSTIGLHNAVEALELPEEENFHNALNDAVYTARVFKKVSNKNPQLKIFNSKHIPKPGSK